MEDKICLDSDFLVNFLRNKQEEVDFVKENEISKDLATTYINAFELYYGASKSNDSNANSKAVAALLNRLTLLNFSDESAQKAGETLAKLERKGNLVDFRDLFIGTISLCEGYAIKTKNVKHFENIQGLKVV
jgi:tRNA(fMet)-specific endonuclease VapC